MPHLFSGVAACGLTAAILFSATIFITHLEYATIQSTASELFPLKNQGLAFQRAAARTRNVLPLYGSSELLNPPLPETANKFFRTAPTGFRVSAVGNGGTTTLIMLQKIGALGSDLRGRKVAISLSPNWFWTATTRWDAYEGNFSVLAASEFIFGTALDFRLKRDIASRLLECPSTVENKPLLEFALGRLASGRWIDRVLFCAVWPVGKMETALVALQDHLAALNYIRHQLKSAPLDRSEIVDWSKLIAKTDGANTDQEKAPKQISSSHQEAMSASDATFRKTMDAAPAWIDLELLLRTLAQVHARPLILSMPLGGQFFDQTGVSRFARESYYAKLRELVKRYNFELIQFEEHEEDPDFLYRQGSHLNAEGWIFYNRTLDDFFHGRLPKT